jgi:hypothetical protein
VTVRGGHINVDLGVQTAETLLSAVRKRFPSAYMQGLTLTSSSGTALLQAIAAVGARVSLAIARVERDALVLTASGPARSKGSVQIGRYVGGHGDFSVPAGSIVGTQAGRYFRTLIGVSWVGAATGFHDVPVEATVCGYEWDLSGSFVAATGEIMYGPIDRLVSIEGSLGTLPDPSVLVQQVNPTTGGAAPALDMHAFDLGIAPRPLGINDAQYLGIILGAEDTVSPEAIEYGLTGILAPYGAAFELLEVGTPEFPGLFLDAGSSADSPQDPDTCFAYDMDDTDGYKLLTSLLESRGFMLIVVPIGLPWGAYEAVWTTVMDKHAGGVGVDLIRR